MVWLTSWPYAPTFWIGVAPTYPGMPASASTPDHRRSTASATNGSHGSPAATLTVAPEQEASTSSSRSEVIPRVATSTTVPGKPSSATTTLLPPPSTSTGSPAASAAETASMSSASVSARTQAFAGPPRRRVVWSLRSGTDHGPGHAEHLGPLARDLEGDRDEAVLDALHRAGDHDVDAGVVVGHGDRVGELAAQLDDLGAVGPGRQRHRVHPVRDHARETHGRGDPVGPVDRVEVAAGPGVADQVGAPHGV